MTGREDRAFDVAFVGAALRAAGIDLTPAASEDAWTRYSRSIGADWRRLDNLDADVVRENAIPFAGV